MAAVFTSNDRKRSIRQYESRHLATLPSVLFPIPTHRWLKLRHAATVVRIMAPWPVNTLLERPLLDQTNYYSRQQRNVLWAR